MHQALKALAGAMLLAISVAAHATPLLPNLYDDDLRTDLSADLHFGAAHLVTYDASDDRLTFSAQQLIPELFYVCSRGSCSTTQRQLLQWSGGVDKHGRVTDPGSLTWFADFGSGMELLANGRLLKLGMEGMTIFDNGVRVYQSLQFLFDFDFRSSRISEQSDRALLMFNNQLYSRDLFAADWGCGTNVTYGIENTACEAWSNTGLVGYPVAVPEPSALALLGLSLSAGFFFRRRKDELRRSGVESRIQ